GDRARAGREGRTGNLAGGIGGGGGGDGDAAGRHAHLGIAHGEGGHVGARRRARGRVDGGAGGVVVRGRIRGHPVVEQRDVVGSADAAGVQVDRQAGAGRVSAGDDGDHRDRVRPGAAVQARGRDGRAGAGGLRAGAGEAEHLDAGQAGRVAGE